ncbi:MAG: tetratricopeptide repeat protein, partial [Saprospiraceae bacterium]|nr:tetratricopeptide repeat protein [Saprospiraceae bacterium]
MKNPIHLTTFLLLSLPLFSQQSMIDSLEKALVTAREDTFKVQMLGNLAYYTFNTDPEKSLEYANQTLALSKKLNYLGGEVNGWYKRALANLSMANMDTAAYQIDRALELALEDGNANRILGVYNLGGVIYDRKGDMDKAIDYIFESAKISERIGDTLGASGAYTNLGEIYDRKGEINLALDFYRKAYNLSKISNDTMNVVASANNLGGIEPDLEKRLAYLEEALALANTTNFDNGRGYVYTGLAAYYWDIKKDTKKALEYYRNAIYYSMKSGDNFNAVSVYTDIGALFSILGQRDSALYYLNKGKNLSQDYGVEEQQIESRVELANHFERYGQFQPAYQNIKELVALKDSMFNHSLAQQLAIANTKYETEKKEAQIAEQELKLAQEVNTRNRIIFGSLILLLIVAGIFQWYFSRQKIKKKEAELALEKELEEAKRLRELDNLKTSFFTNISHELRTPLTLITGPLEAVLDGETENAAREDLEMAHSNSKKLLALVNEILDLSKL